MTKRLLDQNNIPHIIVDVTEDAAALDTVTGLGYQSLPVVVTAQGHWSGFRPERVKELAAA